MQKITILFLSLFLSFQLNSQDIIINFFASGASSDIDYVQIENLTTGVTISTTNDFINLSTVTQINDLSSNIYDVVAFPNPFAEKTMVKFYSNENQTVNITVTDVSGKLFMSQQKEVNIGNVFVDFSVPQAGVFIMSITGVNFSVSQKVVCLATYSNECKLNFRTVNSSQKNNAKDVFFELGNMLKFTAFSGNYSSIIALSPTVSDDLTFEFFDCTDFNTNNYPSVRIGDQIWMAENLKSINYANGGSVTGSYSSNNNPSNDDVFGKLYTWSAVMNGADGTNDDPSGIQGICPNGWHVPSEIEWDELRDYLGGWELMHGAVKHIGTQYWISPNSDATNSTGMTLLPAGCRFDDGDFQYFGEQAFLWNATDDLSGVDLLHASGYTFFSELPSASYYIYTWNLKTMAQSIRCVKD